MTITYAGVDITDACTILEASACDRADGLADDVSLLFLGADRWTKWGPTLDDVVELTEGGYRTGKMYVDTLRPEGDSIRLMARAFPARVGEKKWAAYEEITLAALMRVIADEMELDYALYGVAGATKYERIVRRGETGTAFLKRVLEYEGAVLKCADGILTGISILWAQRREAIVQYELHEEDRVFYRLNRAARYAACRMGTPLAAGTATDADGTGGAELRIGDAPLFSNEQAARWARGVLLMRNRQTEWLQMTIEADEKLYALARVDLTGSLQYAGEWVIDQMRTDFMRGTCAVLLRRCATGIQ